MTRFLALLLLAGCASFTTEVELHYDANMAPVTVITFYGECPKELSRGNAADGCATDRPVYVNFIAATNEGRIEQVKVHEKEHVAGGRHGPWHKRGGDMCAVITAAGQTTWIPGNYLCQRDDGTQHQVKP